jgi:aspartokinase-like uncharacterized kinase
LTAIVVKLGGSLAEAGSLRAWLDPLIENGAGRCVVVPGGGIFADAVRTGQTAFRFSDGAAHRMALLAMEQYALLLADLAPMLRPCASEGEIAAALASRAVALWRPCAMVEADPGVAASWEVTSDSLAAWLARRLGAAKLVLVKSARLPPRPHDPAALARLGIVDAAFPAYMREARFAFACCGPGEERRLAREIAP